MYIGAKKIVSVLVCITVAAALFGVQPVLMSKNNTANAKTGYTYKILIKAGPLTIRSKASTSGAVKGYIPAKKTVKATLKVKGSDGAYWYKTTYNGRTGFIHSGYVKLKSTATTFSPPIKRTITAGPLSIRTGASTSKTLVGYYQKGTKVNTYGYYKAQGSDLWYKVKYGGAVRYICGKFTAAVPVTKTTSKPKTTTKKSTTTSKKATTTTTTKKTGNFETYMRQQGFPESYKPYLRALHKKHPKWVFKAQKTGLNWSSMLKKEKKSGNNCVEVSASSKYKSKKWPYYNSLTKHYKVYDGSWNQANDKTIKYFLDPRNGLNEKYIYQFMTHTFSAKSQNKSTVRALTSMNYYCTWNTNQYATWLYKAGKAANVNPNVLTAMLIEEQGWVSGSSLISGNYPGYRGYYNYFNIGAYTGWPIYNKVARGLWFAKGEWSGKKSYGRPWNTRFKALKGGALFYRECYTSKNQKTYYTKKFNVMNGLSNVAEHEYMTNVAGARDEGLLLKYSYRHNSNYANVFYIPVYKNMPAKACAKP